MTHVQQRHPVPSAQSTPHATPAVSQSQSQARRRHRKHTTRASPNPPIDADASADSDEVMPQAMATTTDPCLRHCRRGLVTRKPSPAAVVGLKHEAPQQRALQGKSGVDSPSAGVLGLTPARALTPTLVTHHHAQQSRPRHSRSRSAATFLTDGHFVEWDMPIPHHQPTTVFTWQQRQRSFECTTNPKEKRTPRRRSKSLKASDKPAGTARNREHSPVHIGAIRISSSSGHDSVVTPRATKYPASVPNQAPVANGLLKTDNGPTSKLTWQQSLFRDVQSNNLSATDLFGPLEPDDGKRTQSAPVSPPKRPIKKGMNGVKGHADALESKLTKLAIAQSSPADVFLSTPARQPSSKQSSMSPTRHVPAHLSILPNTPSASSSPLKSAHTGGAYAGPGFHNSPSAGDLPIPKFKLRGSHEQIHGFNHASIVVSP